MGPLCAPCDPARLIGLVFPLVRELAGGFIMWLRPKCLKEFSYVNKYADLKNQTLKEIG